MAQDFVSLVTLDTYSNTAYSYYICHKHSSYNNISTFKNNGDAL